MRLMGQEEDRNMRIKEGNEDQLEEPKRLIHSSSSFVIVQNDLVTAMMNDQIIQTLPFIDENSNELDEPLDAIRTECSTLRLDTNKTIEKEFIKKSGNSFQVKRSKNKNYKASKVRRFYFL